jgi:hypothetical protein
MTIRAARNLALLALVVTTIAASALVSGGCAGRPELIPNPDPSLRKTAAQLAADAAMRHPYKADAERAGDAVARAQVGYSLNRIEMVNLSDTEWNDVEVWVNQNYVVFLRRMEPGRLKRIPFQALYDNRGNSFPLTNRKVLVERVELFRDGQMYSVPLQLAD